MSQKKKNKPNQSVTQIAKQILTILNKSENDMVKACLICLEPGRISCNCPLNSAKRNYVLLDNYQIQMLQQKTFEKQKINKPIIKQIDLSEQIEQIFVQNTVKDVEKAQKINALMDLCKTKEYLDKLKKNFNNNLYKVIMLKLGQCQTDSKLALLNIFEFIIECQTTIHTFLEQVNNVGLIMKIEQLIRQKTSQETQKDCPISEVIEQLVRIYISINKNFVINETMLKLCVKIVQRNLQYLIKILKDNKKSNENEQMNKMNSMSLMIKILENQINPINQEKSLINQENILEYIAILIHINCPDVIACSHRIKVSASSAFYCLQKSILKFVQRIIVIEKIKDQYIKKKDLFTHIAQQIHQFVQKNHIRRTSQTQDLQQFDESIQISLESQFDILNYYLDYGMLERNATSKVSEFFFLIPSLEKLALFKICEHINKNHDKKLAQLREVARNCLWNILWHGNTNAIKQLVNYSYVEMLVISISTGGGCVQQQNNEIDDQLQILSDFFLVIRKGRYPYQQQLGLLQVLLPLPSLAKVVEELVEQIGGVEEIETRNISQSNKYYGVQKSNANYVLQAIVNYYQHRTNVRHYDGLGDEMFDENEESDDDDDFDGDFLAQNVWPRFFICPRIQNVKKVISIMKEI